MSNRGLRYRDIVKVVKALDGKCQIRYDFGDFSPKGFCSYRGYYEDCAIGYEEGTILTASDWLHELESMKGAMIEGYKGGEYIINNYTNIWVANHSSDCTGTIITKIREFGYNRAIIFTSYED